MRFTVILCEGFHDVNFLCRIFESTGFKRYSKAIGNMPSPLNSYFLKTLRKYEYEDLSLENCKPPLPSAILRDGGAKNREVEHLILLHAFGGIDNHDKAKGILRSYCLLSSANSSGEEIELWDEKTDYSFAVFIDANDTGLENREKSIRDLFQKLKLSLENEKVTGHALENLDTKNLKHGIIETLDNSSTSIGCFIFTADGNKGKLEDIILPLMKSGNETIFDEAGEYFKKHCRIPNPTEGRKQKAVIGIAGQLEKPGVANTVIIRGSRYLSDEKIRDASTCREIINFFSTLLLLP